MGIGLAVVGLGTNLVVAALQIGGVKVNAVVLWVVGGIGGLLMLAGGFILLPIGPGARREPVVISRAKAEVPRDALLAALRAAERDGNALAGEAASLEPVGNWEVVKDLVRRYNDFEAKVADRLASTVELDPEWRAEWLRDPEWHAAEVLFPPVTRDDLDGMARMIGRRVRLLGEMIRSLRENGGKWVG